MGAMHAHNCRDLCRRRAHRDPRKESSGSNPTLRFFCRTRLALVLVSLALSILVLSDPLMMADPRPHGRPPDPIAPPESPTNLTEVAPRKGMSVYCQDPRSDPRVPPNPPGGPGGTPHDPRRTSQDDPTHPHPTVVELGNVGATVNTRDRGGGRSVRE